MNKRVFVHESRIDARPEEVFRWHARAGALERLTPPWDPVAVLERHGGLAPGSRVRLETRIGPFRRRWTAEHTHCVADESFRDVMREGPFELWEHTHTFEPEGAGTLYRDRVEYALPFGRLGDALAGAYVRARLARMFAHRHRVVARDIELHARCGPARRVALTGASGLLGSSLAPFLSTGGHALTRLVRRAARSQDELSFDPRSGVLDARRLEGIDAVVHLAGEGIATRRWSAAQKERIRASRVEGTRVLCAGLARLERKPEVLVCASAVGFFGDRGDEWLDEGSAAGAGFLARVCSEWEQATHAAAEAGIRVVRLRFGLILSPAGGALAKMLPPFRLGLGGPIGGGRQYVSWIALDDALGAVLHALATPQLAGPVAVVAPSPVEQRELARTLGRVLRRPALAPLPAFAARVAFGEMASELLLASKRVRPLALERSGYEFQYPELELALRHLLGR